jgi:hypothetical protein
LEPTNTWRILKKKITIPPPAPALYLLTSPATTICTQPPPTHPHVATSFVIPLPIPCSVVCRCPLMPSTTRVVRPTLLSVICRQITSCCILRPLLSLCCPPHISPGLGDETIGGLAWWSSSPPPLWLSPHPSGKRPFGSGWFCRLPSRTLFFLLCAFCRRRNTALLLIVVWSHSI